MVTARSGPGSTTSIRRVASRGSVSLVGVSSAGGLAGSGRVGVDVVVVRVVEEQEVVAHGDEPPAVGVAQADLGEDLVGRSGGHDPPGQQQHQVGPAGVGQVVGRGDDGAAGVALGLDGGIDERRGTRRRGR